MQQVNLIVNFVDKNYYHIVNNVPVNSSVSRVLQLLFNKICENPENIDFENLTIVSSGFVIPMEKSIGQLTVGDKGQITIFVKGDFEIKKDVLENFSTFQNKVKQEKKKETRPRLSKYILLIIIVIIIIRSIQIRSMKTFFVYFVVIVIVYAIIQFLMPVVDILSKNPEHCLYLVYVLFPTWDSNKFKRKFKMKIENRAD